MIKSETANLQTSSPGQPQRSVLNGAKKKSNQDLQMYLLLLLVMTYEGAGSCFHVFALDVRHVRHVRHVGRVGHARLLEQIVRRQSSPTQLWISDTSILLVGPQQTSWPH